MKKIHKFIIVIALVSFVVLLGRPVNAFEGSIITPSSDAVSTAAATESNAEDGATVEVAVVTVRSQADLLTVAVSPPILSSSLAPKCNFISGLDIANLNQFANCPALEIGQNYRYDNKNLFVTHGNTSLYSIAVSAKPIILTPDALSLPMAASIPSLILTTGFSSIEVKAALFIWMLVSLGLSVALASRVVKNSPELAMLQSFLC